MTYTDMEPADTTAVEPKVKWGTVAATILTAVIGAVLSILNNADVVSGVPDWVTVLVATLLTGGATFGSGYKAPHQLRSGEGDTAGTVRP